MLSALIWLSTFVRRARARFQAEEKERLTVSLDLEIALMMLVGVHAVVQAAGGLTGQLYPLVYVLVAFVASFAKKPMGTVLVVAAVVFEALLYFVTERQREPQPYFLHATFIVFFGLMNLLFTRAEIERVRERRKRAADEDKLKALEDARRYRLIERAERSAPSATRSG